MEKYRLIGIGLVLGTIIAAIIFFLGITYISDTITLIISITIATLLLFGYFLIKYNVKRNIEIDKHEEKVKKLASEVKSIFPTINNEQSLKGLISSSIQSIRKIYTSTFLLSTFFSLSMVIVGLLASAIAIKQNNTMRDQNYLICQQTQYLAVKFNPYLNPNKELYDYFERLKNNIRKLLGKSIEFKYTSSLGADIRNDKYNKNLPQKEFTQILNLRKKIIRIEKDNGVADLMQNQNYLSLVKEYKQLLKGFYDLIVNKENQMKAEEKEKTIDFNDCKKYNE